MKDKKVYYVIGMEIEEYELLKSGKKISWVFRPNRKDERDWVINVDNDKLFFDYEKAKKSVINYIQKEIDELEDYKKTLNK